MNMLILYLSLLVMNRRVFIYYYHGLNGNWYFIIRININFTKLDLFNNR